LVAAAVDRGAVHAIDIANIPGSVTATPAVTAVLSAGVGGAVITRDGGLVAELKLCTQARV
jgi:hypothetical protein